MKDPIYLRPLEKEDLEQVKEWINSPEIGKIMGYLPVLSNHEQLLWFEGIKKLRTTYVFAICESTSRRHIGNVGLGNIDYINRHGMLNIFIADKSCRGKGFGRAAVKGLLDFAFSRLNLNKVYLQTSPSFAEAIRLYEAIGFTKEGVMREHHICDGVYSDKVIYSILHSEYRS